MYLFPLLFALLLNGCFAVYLTDSNDKVGVITPARHSAIPGSTPLLGQGSGSRVYEVIYSPESPTKRISERDLLERFKGNGSLGHQYLLFFPLTRLYLEEGPQELLLELLPERGNLVVTNLEPSDVRHRLGQRTKLYSIVANDLSVSAFDLFFLRRLCVTGAISLSGNAKSFEKCSYSKTGSAEELYEILKEALLEELLELKNFPLSTKSPENSEATTPLVLCNQEDIPNFRALQIGMERGLRELGRSFLSFRNNCGATEMKEFYLLKANSLTIETKGDYLTLSGNISLEEHTEGRSSPLASRNISLELDKRGEPTEIESVKILGEELIKQALK